MISDTIADMLTRIRNGQAANHAAVTMPSSRMRVEIARVLEEQGFIAGYSVEGELPRRTLTITFKPAVGRRRALNGLRRVSRPGLRVYAKASEIPRVLGGLGIAIVSTSHGLMTGQAAQRSGLGGEIVAHVW